MCQKIGLQQKISYSLHLPRIYSLGRKQEVVTTNYGKLRDEKGGEGTVTHNKGLNFVYPWTPELCFQLQFAFELHTCFHHCLHLHLRVL